MPKGRVKLYLRRTFMDSEPATNHESPAPEKTAGYQPTVGRKLFMLALCILGLIIVWTYYFSQSSKP